MNGQELLLPPTIGQSKRDALFIPRETIPRSHTELGEKSEINWTKVVPTLFDWTLGPKKGDETEPAGMCNIKVRMWTGS